MRVFFAAVMALLLIRGRVLAALDYSSIGDVLSENFNSLGLLDMGNPWTNDPNTPPSGTLPGWSLFRATSDSDLTPIAVTGYDASDGSATGGRFYSFGDSGDNERALGSVGDFRFGDVFTPPSQINFGHALGWMAVSIVNNTGVTIDRFTVGFDGEQWRDGGNGPGDQQTMAFDYRIGTTFDTAATWFAPGGNFDFVAPISGSGGPLDGNSIGSHAGLGGTVGGLNWAPGEILWLRWTEVNDVGGDSGMGIDNFSFSAGLSAVPEPSAALFALIAAMANMLHRLHIWSNRHDQFGMTNNHARDRSGVERHWRL